MGTDEWTASSLSFTDITISDKEQIESIRAISGNTLYTYTFTTLFAWKDAERYKICLKNDAYLVKNGSRGSNAYLFPCGGEEGKIKLIDELISRERPVFYFVSNEDKAFLEKNYPGKFQYVDCRNDYPYLYDKNEQIALKGKTYRKLRHWINNGEKSAEEWTCETLTKVNVDRARTINRIWTEKVSSDGVGDMNAVTTALDYFEELDMWGLIFVADGQDVAYVAGSFVTPEIFDVNFCKVLDRNLDCYIKWLLYKALPSEVKYVDSEEDMGLEGLRTHKLLRKPIELTTVWKGSMK